MTNPAWVHDDVDEVLFVAPARRPAAEAPRPAAAPAAEPAQTRPPRDDAGNPPHRAAGDPVEADTGDEGRARHPRGERFPRRDRDDRPRPEAPAAAPSAPAGPHAELRPAPARPHRGEDRGPRHHEPRRHGTGHPENARHEPRRHGRPHEEPRSTAGAAPAPARGKARAAETAILIDLAALQAEAREQGGELAVHRLRAGLANGAPVQAAVCFAPANARAPSGFEVVSASGHLIDGVQFTARAFALAAEASLVLAPATPAMLALAVALRQQGHAVELAGFVARDDDGRPTRRLGRDCLFVP